MQDESFVSSNADVDKLVALVYRQQDARLRRIAVSRMVRTIKLSIQAWREHLLAQRRRDEAEFGIILRKLRTTLKNTLAMWSVYARKCSRLRKLGVSMLLRVLARYRIQAFRQWNEMCGGLSAMGTNYANLLAHCYTRCLADHFFAWAEYVSHRTRQSNVVARAASTWLHARVRRAWKKWDEATQVMKRMRAVGLKVMYNWLNVHMNLILRLWRKRTVLTEAVAMMRTRNESLRIADTLKGCMDHWCFMSSKQALNHVKHKIVMIMRGSLAEAFVCWHEHTVTTRRWAKALRSTMAKMHKKMAFTTFYDWRLTVRRSLELHETGIRILVKNMERNLQSIFGCWQAVSVRSKLWIHVQKKVMKIDKQTLYIEHFRAWRGMVGDRKKELQNIVQGWKEYKNPAGREGAMLVRVLYAWRTIAEEGAKLRRTGVKVLLRWLNSSVKEMFWRWILAVGLARQYDLHTKNIESTRGRAVLKEAFTEWYAMRQNTNTWSDLVLHIGLKWTTAELSAVFKQFKEVSQLLRSRRIHYARARRRVIWNCKRSTILEWSCYTYDARRLWHAGSVILSRWTASLLSSTLSHWILMMTQQRQKTMNIKVAIAKICSRDTESAFYAWQWAWEEAKAQAHIDKVNNTRAISLHAQLQADPRYASENSQSLDTHRTGPSGRGQAESIYGSSASGSHQAHAAVGDPWSSVLTQLSAQQRMGVHMLGMQRTWETVSSHFAAWASMRGSPMPLDAEPPEPDVAPSLLLDAVEMQIKLGLDFSISGAEDSAQRASFEQTLIQDLSNAAGLSAASFRIKGMSPGSILVIVKICRDPSGLGPEPKDAAFELETQAQDENSALRHGTLTCYTESLVFPSLGRAWSNVPAHAAAQRDLYTTQQPDFASDLAAHPPSPSPYAPNPSPYAPHSSPYAPAPSPTFAQASAKSPSLTTPSPDRIPAVIMSNFPRQQVYVCVRVRVRVSVRVYVCVGVFVCVCVCLGFAAHVGNMLRCPMTLA